MVVAKLVTLSILLLISFTLALRSAVFSNTKLVTLGISPLTSFILALKVVLVDTLVISVVLSSIFVIPALYTLF